MAALAYALLPVTGLVAFLTAADARIRFHGLQAVALGLVWALLLYAGAAISGLAAQVVFLLGLALWLGFLLGTLLGKDPRLPWLAAMLAVTAAYERDEVGLSGESD